MKWAPRWVACMGWAVVVYDWHHGDGGVHEGADECSGEDNIRNGVANSEEGYDEAC
jgi:hypothetical protein